MMGDSNSNVHFFIVDHKEGREYHLIKYNLHMYYNTITYFEMMEGPKYTNKSTN